MTTFTETFAADITSVDAFTATDQKINSLEKKLEKLDATKAAVDAIKNITIDTSYHYENDNHGIWCKGLPKDHGGQYFWMGVKTLGNDIITWGHNYNGYQLGHGERANEQSAPRRVPIPKSDGFDTIVDWDLGRHAGAICVTDGSTQKLYTWGHNPEGQLGHGDTTARPMPTEVTIPSGKTIKYVYCCSGMGYGSYVNQFWLLMTDGTCFAAGQNSHGQLGVGDTTNRTTFTAISGLSDVSYMHADGLSTWFLEGPWSDNSGVVYACGYNQYGQLGVNNTTNQSTPTAVTTSSGDAINGANQILSTSDHNLYTTATYISDNQGDIYATGSNGSGRLGNGNTTQQNQFVRIVSNSGSNTDNPPQMAICGGSDGSFIFQDTDNKLYGCGSNVSGEFGDGNTTARTTPYDITTNLGLTTGVISTEDFRIWGSLNSPFHVFYALNKSTGKLFGAGYNPHGCLGMGLDDTGITTGSEIPLPEMPLEIHMQGMVSGSNYSTHYILGESGTLYVSGYGGSSQLGQPVNVGSNSNSTFTPVFLPLVN